MNVAFCTFFCAQRHIHDNLAPGRSLTVPPQPRTHRTLPAPSPTPRTPKRASPRFNESGALPNRFGREPLSLNPLLGLGLGPGWGWGWGWGPGAVGGEAG